MPDYVPDQKPSLLARIRSRFSNRSGQSTTEYILILAIVVMIASKMKGKLDTSLTRNLEKLDEKINTWDQNP
jgi:hypothetical protein